MKESLIDYATSLSNQNIDVLEDLIIKKYRKFIKFFHLIRDFTPSIKKMEYDFADKETLSITITFTKSIKLDTKKDLISDMEKSGYKVNSKITGKKVKLTIKYKE